MAAQQQDEKPRSMIEIVARQMAGDVGAKTLGEAERENYTERYWREYVHQARSVLQAIREPNQPMCGAGAPAIDTTPEMFSADRAYGVWQAMIDAALRESL